MGPHATQTQGRMPHLPRATLWLGKMPQLRKILSQNNLQQNARRDSRFFTRDMRDAAAQAREGPAGRPDLCARYLGAPYRPTRRLDRQGPVWVFRARSPQEAGPGCYVLKIPLAPGVRSEQPALELAIARLRREAEVAQQVVHRNLTTVLDVLTRGQSLSLVLPYRDGASLRQVLDWYRGQHLAAPCGLALWWVAGVLRQVAAALAAMHQAGWMHGQVQPDHVLVHPSGHACLIDLTAARRLQTPECLAGVGGPRDLTYGAPEWSHPRGPVTAAADVYALGCVLWECLTGHPPFGATTASELVRLHRHAALPSLRSIRPDIAWDTAGVVCQMLAKEPLRRPSAAQVETWLVEIALDVLPTGCALVPAHLAAAPPSPVRP